MEQSLLHTKCILSNNLHNRALARPMQLPMT